VAVDDDGRRAAEDSRRHLEAMTPERSLRAARFMREYKPLLRNDRQRGLAEQMARRFEARAAAKASDRPSA
jgi:hypothetical protein